MLTFEEVKFHNNQQVKKVNDSESMSLITVLLPFCEMLCNALSKRYGCRVLKQRYLRLRYLSGNTENGSSLPTTGRPYLRSKYGSLPVDTGGLASLRWPIRLQWILRAFNFQPTLGQLFEKPSTTSMGSSIQYAWPSQIWQNCTFFLRLNTRLGNDPSPVLTYICL